MKKRIFCILAILTSLLFTSCLADYLNDKFGYFVPFYIYYDTDYGEAPESKKCTEEYTLTAADLPNLSSAEGGQKFLGWYLDKNFQKQASSGKVLKSNTTLFAKWEEIVYYTVWLYSFDNNFLKSFSIKEGSYLTEETFAGFLEQTPAAIPEGYSYEGFYLNLEHTENALNTLVNQNINIYIKLLPCDDTPFTIEYYFMDTAANSYEFIKQDSLTRRFTGTTGTIVNSYNYTDGIVDPQYEVTLWSEENEDDPYGPTWGTIKGDGSSVFKVFFFGCEIYDYQLEPFVTALPNKSSTYTLVFKNPPESGASSLNLEEVKTTIYNDYNNIHSAEQDYYKVFSINLGRIEIKEIQASLFLNCPWLESIYFPTTLEKVGTNAFLNCERLNIVCFTDEYEWKYFENGTVTDFDKTDPANNAYFLKNYGYELFR